MAGLQKENRELGEKLAAAGLESSEKAREVSELGAKVAVAEKAAEKLRQAVKKLERERDARPAAEALVRRRSLPADVSLVTVQSQELTTVSHTTEACWVSNIQGVRWSDEDIPYRRSCARRLRGLRQSSKQSAGLSGT